MRHECVDIQSARDVKRERRDFSPAYTLHGLLIYVATYRRRVCGPISLAVPAACLARPPRLLGPLLTSRQSVNRHKRASPACRTRGLRTCRSQLRTLKLGGCGPSAAAQARRAGYLEGDQQRRVRAPLHFQDVSRLVERLATRRRASRRWRRAAIGTRAPDRRVRSARSPSSRTWNGRTRRRLC